MNYKKICAITAALCIFTAAVMNDYGSLAPESVRYAYAEDREQSNTVTLACVGDKAPISISGTTEKPTWSSLDPSVAIVTPTGDQSADIIAVGKGQTSVMAQLSGQLIRFDVIVLRESADEQVFVEVGSITLTNTQPSATANLSNVDNSAAEWSSSDPNVASVDSNGEIVAVGKGSCVISAVYGNTTYTVKVTSEYDPANVPAPEEICIGEMTLTNEAPSQKITFDLSDNTVIKFSSTDENVAAVSDDGVITAKGAGTCRIYAEIENVKNYINVTSTYTGQTQDSSEIGNITLTAAAPSQKISLSNIPEDMNVTWSSSDDSVAVVNINGVVVAVGSGNCKVTANVGGKEYVINIKVDVSDVSELTVTEINGIGKTLTLSTENMEGSIKFSTTDSSVAAVDENGVVTAVGEGFAVIVAESSNIVSFLRVKVVKTGLIGDANCDGKVDIADATIILQCLGNPDKYKLSEQGKRNGDVDGEQGISGMDAVVIQAFDAKMISSLPLAPKK